MRTSNAGLLVCLVLCSCQTDPAMPGLEDADRDQASLSMRDPGLAAMLASDMAGSLKAFLPPGARLKIDDAGGQDLLADALEEALAGQGYVFTGQNGVDTSLFLKPQTLSVDGDLILRIVTPSHRLTRAYRLADTDGAGKAGEKIMHPLTGGRGHPTGPLLVEALMEPKAS